MLFTQGRGWGGGALGAHVLQERGGEELGSSHLPFHAVCRWTVMDSKNNSLFCFGFKTQRGRRWAFFVLQQSLLLF